MIKSYQRLILRHAESVKIDKNSRILLPATLRQMITLDRDVALVGMGSKFELWSKDKWEIETNQALTSPREDLAHLLNGFSI